MRFIPFLLAIALIAQSPAVQRTVVQKKDISTRGREAVMARVELAPGGFAGRHTHVGEEVGYMLEGDFELLIDGQPALVVKPGESFFIPAGVTHNGHNRGTAPVKFISTYIVEKGVPLTTPVQ